MKRVTQFVVLMAVIVGCSVGNVMAQDLLDGLLNSVGKSREDLGYHPKGYWNRYPYEIPYKLPAFDDLLSEPMRAYDYSQSMKEAVLQYLEEEAFWDTSNPSLYQLLYHLGWERRVGGFRNYSANLTDSITAISPLWEALEGLYKSRGASLKHRVFGQVSPAVDSASVATLETQLSYDAQLAIAILLTDLLEAAYYQEMAFRRVPGEVISALYSVTDLDATQGDGLKYYPQFDDCAATLDWQSLVYASYKTTASADRAAKTLAQYELLLDRSVSISTPAGEILFLSSGRDTVYHGDYLLLLDFGGDDLYLSGGGSNPGQPLSVVLDLGGDDQYGTAHSSRAFGYGNCGVGVVIDVGGNDRYLAERLAQGTGVFGTGILCDYAGDDRYTLQVSGQGCGYFGVGMLMDRGGKDEYYIAGDGQGMGGVGGGIGLLVDYRGSDKYTAEPYASVFNRADYHSENVINANIAQGCGSGRRGDGSDGHSWAGGLGALIDCFGDDEYYAGNFSQGIGYWFGIGVLYDVNGNDLYRSCYFTQASGAHYCIGALFDETGDDRHELFETAGAGLSFGWDFTISMLVDWEGNDSYSAKIISIATAQIRSNSFFFDFGGDDLYELDQDTHGFGHASFREDYRNPRPTTPFTWYAQSYALLVDSGGDDRYLRRNSDTDSLAPDSVATANARWYQPGRDSGEFGYDNYGIGIDTTAGSVSDFFIFRQSGD